MPLMRYSLYYILLSFLLCACAQGKGDVDPETEAGQLIAIARQLITDSKYAEAKDTILYMRKEFPTAFNARATGIIVMDSAELMEAQDSLAVLIGELQREEDFLQQLEAESPNVRSAAFYKQRTKVFYQKQHLDEVNAKVKFFLRKIEIDQRKNEETPIL